MVNYKIHGIKIYRKIDGILNENQNIYSTYLKDSYNETRDSYVEVLRAAGCVVDVCASLRSGSS